MTPESNPILESWLQIATNDLTSDAALSVRKEITDHVKTTLEYQTNAGLSQVEAEKVAVRLLGDPVMFLKNARKNYLTTNERKLLNNFVNKSKFNRSFHQMFFTFILLLMAYQFYRFFPQHYDFIAVDLSILSTQIPGLLSEKLSSKFKERFAIIWTLTSMGLLGVYSFLVYFLIPIFQHRVRRLTSSKFLARCWSALLMRFAMRLNG